MGIRTTPSPPRWCASQGGQSSPPKYPSIQQTNKQQVQTPSGTLHTTSLANFRSDFTIVRIPHGDFLAVKDQLYTNIGLLRMGCIGRSAVGLEDVRWVVFVYASCRIRIDMSFSSTAKRLKTASCQCITYQTHPPLQHPSGNHRKQSHTCTRTLNHTLTRILITIRTTTHSQFRTPYRLRH
jgi:hypothetical protein